MNVGGRGAVSSGRRSSINIECRRVARPRRSSAALIAKPCCLRTAFKPRTQLAVRSRVARAVRAGYARLTKSDPTASRLPTHRNYGHMSAESRAAGCRCVNPSTGLGRPHFVKLLSTTVQNFSKPPKSIE